MTMRLSAVVLVVAACVMSLGGAGFHGPPTAPERVWDGERPGVDVDESENTLNHAVSWSGSIDETGRPVSYEWCLRERHERCTDERWFHAGRDPDHEEFANLAADPGEWLLSCIRARDLHGNYSRETCSDGYLVVPARSEVESIARDRASVGLESDPDVVEQMARDGEFGDAWTRSHEQVPTVPGERPDYTSLEFDTWMLDHPRAVGTLYQRGLTMSVPTGTRRLEVATSPSCTPADELRLELGDEDVAAAPVAAPARRFVAAGGSAARSLARAHVLGDPEFERLGIEDVRFVDGGVPHACLQAIGEWLARPDVKRYLAGRHPGYTGATVTFTHVWINADGELDLPGRSRWIRARVGGPPRGTSMTADIS